MGSTILLVADKRDASGRKLVKSLVRSGFRVTRVGSAVEALVVFGRMNPDLIIFDWDSSGIDPQTFLGTVRSASSTPILVISDDGDEGTELQALQQGADNCVSRPEDPRVIVARCDVLLRRAGPKAPSEAHVIDSARGIVLDEIAQKVTQDGHPIDLTPTEYALLVELATDVGRMLTREELTWRVWDDDPARNPRLIDPHMSRLRNKIEQDAQHPVLISTVRGRGYRLDFV